MFTFLFLSRRSEGRNCVIAPSVKASTITVEVLILTFSVLATTIARMATSTYVSHMATGGLLPLALLRSVTSCIRAPRMSALRITITAGTVLPFAVWYGRGERGSSRKEVWGL